MNKELLEQMSNNGELKGIYDHIDNELYHNSVGLSKSSLLLFDKDPVKFHYKYILGNKEETKSEALKFGTLMHEILLEPNMFFDKYRTDNFALLNGSRRTKAYKESIDDFYSEFPGKVLINDEIYSKLIKIKEAVYKNPIVKMLLEAKGKAEQTIYWTDPITKILCKCRLDKLLLDYKLDDYKTTNFIVEIKSTTDVFDFEKSIAKYKYYLQDAWYRSGAKYALGIKDIQPIFIAVDKEPPFHCRIGQLDFATEGLGKKIGRTMLNKFSTALEKGFIPEPIIETFNLPDWEFKKQEANIND